MFHVTRKLLSRSLIVNLLNKEIMMDFDVKDLKRRYFLTLHQKLNLEENLKQILSLYFTILMVKDLSMKILKIMIIKTVSKIANHKMIVSHTKTKLHQY
jgi:hypothetical protein